MAVKLEQRVAALEDQIAEMKRREIRAPVGREWMSDLYGKFAGDTLFKQAMALGKQYRKSLRPGARKTKSK